MTNHPSRSGRRQFWEHLIARFAESGLNQIEYCRSNKISVKRFYYWKRRSKGRIGAPLALVELPLPENLPRIEIIEDIEESEKVCACGAKLSRIGEDTSEKLDIIPVKIQVIRTIRPQYACKNCEGVESGGPTVKIAPAPPQITPKGIATPGLVAYVAVSKYADALPLYRQEKIFKRIGADISRSTMAGWMVMAAQGSKPVMDLLYKRLHCGPLINIDGTPVEVLNEPGRENTTKSYMWVFRGGPPQKPVLIYR